MLTVRNVCCDFYLERPNEMNRHINQYAARLPILRIFGIMESGQKCCVHIHGVFPYIILKTGIPFTGHLENKIRRILFALVDAKNSKISYGFRSAIHAIIPLETKSLYGFHLSNEHFIKIQFFDPFYVKSLAIYYYNITFSLSCIFPL
ncbi:unnamed protein product [Dracunculus medinensis]|uniref:DNA_pol_B_exo1 domain-containing protein n=1 Tax=Dracunculus medinensis TaxID=318479 RepID=A0A0N4ULP3_DRAME|nr:unnamed protein product [Dracunculus medinensis]